MNFISSYSCNDNYFKPLTSLLKVIYYVCREAAKAGVPPVPKAPISHSTSITRTPSEPNTAARVPPARTTTPASQTTRTHTRTVACLANMTSLLTAVRRAYRPGAQVRRDSSLNLLPTSTAHQRVIARTMKLVVGH